MRKDESLTMIGQYGPALSPEVLISLETGNDIPLAPMKYKDFTWKSNPRTTTYSSTREYISHKYPEMWGPPELEDTSTKVAVISGSGEFWGPTAYMDWDKLVAAYQSHGPGTFFHPVYKDVTMALMTKLEGVMEPIGNYITYTFEFVQHIYWEDSLTIKPMSTPASLAIDYGDGGSGNTETASEVSSGEYTVVSGDTLWGIASRQYGDGSQWEKIYNANTDKISDPHWIYTGQILTIPA